MERIRRELGDNLKRTCSEPGESLERPGENLEET